MLSTALQGLGVLVTRPEPQATGLCQLIEQQGGVALRCPTVVIAEPRDWTPALAVLDRLAEVDLAIFTSVNAVERAWPLIRERGGFPPELGIAAIGPATARALQRLGAPTILIPETGFTSEALLALPRLQQVAGQAIVIVRGAGGRELLAEILSQRGARVAGAEVYRRERPAVDGAMLRERWARGEIGAVVATSSETVRNLFDLLGFEGQHYLQESPLIVASSRIQRLAVALGCQRLECARDASDAAILDALLQVATLFPSSAR